MSSKRQSRDWMSIYQKYRTSGLSVEQFGRNVGISGTWITKNFRRMAQAGEIVYPLPKELPAEKSSPEETTFLPLDLTEPAEISADAAASALKVTVGRAVIEIPAGFNEQTLRHILRIVCEVC